MLKIQCIGLLSDLRFCPTAISRALFHQCRFMVRVAIRFEVKFRGRVQISYMHVVQSRFVVNEFCEFHLESTLVPGAFLQDHVGYHRLM